MKWLAALAPLAVLAAGCGSQSSRPATTLSQYGAFPAQTVTTAHGDPRAPVCHTRARTFADQSKQFVAHFRPSAVSPADNFYFELRVTLADFEAHGCDRALLRAALERSLTARERHVLVSRLPRAMAAKLS